MTISTILFDLDNTLYPASVGLMESVSARITEYVQNLLGLNPEEAATLVQQYFADYGAVVSGLRRYHAVDIEDYLAYIHDLALESFLSADAELDRVLNEVRATKAIFTNGPSEHARRVLTTLGIEHHFTQIFDIRFLDFQPKPHPAGYQRVLNALGIAGTEAILIEDSSQNIVPARALGMTTILVGEDSHDDAVCRAHHGAPNILAALHIVLALEVGKQWVKTPI